MALLRMHRSLEPLRLPPPRNRTRSIEKDIASESDAEVLLRIVEDVLAALKLDANTVERARELLAGDNSDAS